MMMRAGSPGEVDFSSNGSSAWGKLEKGDVVFPEPLDAATTRQAQSSSPSIGWMGRSTFTRQRRLDYRR